MGARPREKVFRLAGLLPPLRVERKRGRMREMRGRRVGRQAQMIPTLHSMADQVAAPTLSSVGSRSAGAVMEFKSYRAYMLGLRTERSPSS